MSSYNVAIVGATGAVGHEMIKVLEDRKFPVKELRLFASLRSTGKNMSFCGTSLPVEELKSTSFKGVEVALFSAGAGRSLEFAPHAVKSGAVVIDNSSAFRMDPNVPLVVPEINSDDIQKHQGMIANPNCSTIQMVVALNPIHQVSRIKRVIVNTYQAVSGTGMKAIQELENQVKQWAKGEVISKEVYPHQIAFNVLPHVDVFYDTGYTKEEMKMVHETHKIMHDDEMKISATCVRVPVFRAHSEAVHIELEKKLTASQVKEILSKAPGITVQDNPKQNLYPLAIDATGKYNVFVGRIREDIALHNGIALWVVADQLLKGAALNAVQIAECLAL
ncbi:MAG: aspartate-semialdehyde dehydrogenase [Chlamydiae bacterium]|nr:aspartate-semialdehyde dehydrogenase [Chlamydiota bacterium]MBI3276429.1 aspartate-semialdehyde dehydrogenase [Chlamydiota bacterium]